MRFNVNDLIGLIDGENTYQVVERDGDYYKLLCTDYVEDECIGYDVNVYSYGCEIWINRGDFHLFELLS
ncbi:hypothetical protein vBAbaMD22_142 [Acinetobacter phage vB_AbaM_D22]|nr:hypothetical protein vBAbaMD22_142 [Acinetobacter phage vB_AbaM_D22]